jgi:DNA-binding XRE family transcriptional regulator
MDRKQFSKIRQRLGKSQREMAQLLAISIKAVQSFEQGWRNVPAHVERQALFLLAMKESQDGGKACWDMPWRGAGQLGKQDEDMPKVRGLPFYVKLLKILY